MLDVLYHSIAQIGISFKLIALGVFVAGSLLLTIKKPLYGLYVQILLFPFDTYGGIHLGFYNRIFHIMIPIFIMGYFFHTIIYKKKFWFESLLDVPLFFFIAILIISSFQSVYIPQNAFILRDALANYPFIRGIIRLLLLIMLIGFSYTVASLIDETKSLKNAVRIHLLTSSGISLFAVLVFLLGYLDARFVFENDLAIDHGHLVRPKLFFNEPSFLGNYLLSSIPVLIALAFSRNVGDMFKKRTMYVLLFIQCITLFLTSSRSALFGLMAVLIYFSIRSGVGIIFIKTLVNHIKAHKKNAYFYFFVIFLLFLVWEYGLTQIIEKVNPKWRSYSALVRFVELYAGITAFEQHPWFGIGYENFVFYGGPFIIEGVWDWPINLAEINNYPFKILVETGIFGSYFFIQLVAAIGCIIIMKMRQSPGALIEGITASFVGNAAQFLFLSHVYLPHIFFLFGIFLLFARKKIISSVNESSQKENTTVITKKIENIEGDNWWVYARKNLVGSLLDKYNRNGEAGPFIDIGAGTGFVAERINKKRSVIAIDKNIAAKEYVIAKKIPFIQSDATNLPLKSSSVEGVMLLDVLEHVRDAEKCIGECNRILKRGGMLLITVPAFGFLWGEDDVVAGHVQRYTKKSLRRMLTKFKIMRLFYWNFISFFPLVILRLCMPRKKQSVRGDFFQQVYGDQVSLSLFLNSICRFLLLIENKLIQLKIPLPVGISVVAVCKKE